MILQYIVQRINSSGKSHYYVSGNQNYLELPYFNDALVFVAAVNQYGQSSFVQAKSSGKRNTTLIAWMYVYIIIFSYYYAAPCLPSPCINNGTCVTVNATDQYCVCVSSFIGQFCDSTQKVSAEILHHITYMDQSYGYFIFFL